jgi:serine/threonine protein kinase
MGSGEFREEDEKDIDVPLVDLESILAATDNCSDANKLGEGGYGPVYKVISTTLIGVSVHVN